MKTVFKLIHTIWMIAEFKRGYVTRTGPDNFLFTSTSLNGQTIFTHYEVTVQYLRNIGITLPTGF